MGGFSIWHWLVVLVIFGGLAVGFVWLVVSMSRRKPASSSNARVSTGASSLGDADNRLKKLNELRAQGLIKESEYQKQRASIIAGV